MTAHEEQLRRLALHDEGFIEAILAMNLREIQPDAAGRLSPKTQALVRLAAPWSPWGRRPSPTSGPSGRPSTPTRPPMRSSAP